MACAPPCAPFRAPPCTSAHLCAPLHTLLHTSVHLCALPCISVHLRAPLHNFCASLSRASHPYRTFHFALGPLWLPGATQPSCNWAQCPPSDACVTKPTLSVPPMPSL